MVQLLHSQVHFWEHFPTRILVQLIIKIKFYQSDYYYCLIILMMIKYTIYIIMNFVAILYIIRYLFIILLINNDQGLLK